MWGDKRKPFRGGEGFQSSRGAEISSNTMTLDKDVVLTCTSVFIAALFIIART